MSSILQFLFDLTFLKIEQFGLKSNQDPQVERWKNDRFLEALKIEPDTTCHTQSLPGKKCIDALSGLELSNSSVPFFTRSCGWWIIFERTTPLKRHKFLSPEIFYRYFSSRFSDELYSLILPVQSITVRTQYVTQGESIHPHPLHISLITMKFNRQHIFQNNLWDRHPWGCSPRDCTFNLFKFRINCYLSHHIFII